MNEHTSFWFHEFRKLEQSYPAEDLNKETVMTTQDALATILQLIEPNFTKSDSDIILQQDLWHPLPLGVGFSRDGVTQLVKNFHEAEIENWGGFDIVAVVYETTGDLISESAALRGFNDTMRQDAIAYRTLYPAARMALSATRFNEEALDQFAGLGAKIIDNVKGDIEKRFNRLAGAVDEQVEVKVSNALQRIENRSNEILEDLKLNGAKHIESAKEEFKASFVLETAMRLWKIKAAQHTKFFYIGAAVFVLAILLPVGFLFANWNGLTAEFAKLVPQDQPFAIGSLILVTIPTLGYAWILRLISRFTLQNMILADDASQRRVLANTFIRLVGQGDIDEKQDRAIMLNALFRPIPGAKEQDIQPPNLADFINGKN